MLLLTPVEISLAADDGIGSNQGCQVSRILREAHAFCSDLPLASALAIVSRKEIVSRISPAFKVWSECIDELIKNIQIWLFEAYQ